MTVNIDIDLNASGVADDIAIIKTALESLDETSNDVDLGGKIDVDGLTGDLGQVVKKLKNVETQIGNLESRIQSVGENVSFDEITVTHEKDGGTPDGSTGSGDSTGGDPPESGGISRGRRNSILSQNFGVEVEGFLEDTDLNYMKGIEGGYAGRAKNRTVHLSDEDRLPIKKRAFGDFGLGLESVARRERRIQELSSEELADVMDSSSLSDSERKNQALSNVKDRAKLMRAVRDRSKRPTTDMRDNHDLGDGRGFTTKVWRRNGVDFEGIDVDDLAKRFGRFGSSIKKIVPDMGQIYAVVAALIPLLVVLGAQFLGIAAAMGAVAVAGAAIIGLGLVGHADSMGGSIAEAKEQMKTLARESFNAAQGTAQIFAPIQERMFAAIPDEIGKIADSMRGLTAFEDTLFTLGAMLSQGLQSSFRAIADNESAISQLAVRFSDIIGTGIIDFFGWLLKESRNNQDMLIALGGTLKDLATIVFRVFRVLVMFLDAFSPIINIVLFLSRALNNQLFQALLGFAAGAYITASALTKMGLAALQAYSFMAGGGILKAIQATFWTIQAGITRLIAYYTALSAAAASAAAMIAMTGVGLLAVAGGAIAVNHMMSQDSGGSYPRSGMSDSEGTQVYNDNRSYEINQQGNGDYADRKAIEKTVRDVNESKSARQLPRIDN